MNDIVDRLRNSQPWFGQLVVDAADDIEGLRRRVAALENIIAEDLPPWNCRDELNKMLVDEIWRKRALLPLTGSVVSTGSKT